ncbi:MAG: hypothetical protein NT010_05770 [Proteobacteria bacterium]|nr:hypothetical protein [Pseudomonadota bacterium]
MKKALLIVFAIILGVAFVTTVFAQTATDAAKEKATKAATDTAKDKAKAAGDVAKDKATKAATEKVTPAPEKAAPAPAPAKKAVAKAKVKQFTGEVIAVDMAAKTLIAKNKKGDMTFDVTDAKMKSEPKVGDKIFVKYTDKDGKMVAKSVATKNAKKAKKGKTAEKPAAPEKTAAPAPAK